MSVLLPHRQPRRTGAHRVLRQLSALAAAPGVWCRVSEQVGEPCNLVVVTLGVKEEQLR